MLKMKIVFACAGLLLASTGAWAQNLGEGLEPTPDQSTTRVATRGANFLEIPVGARGQALGAGGAALIRGAQSLAWNPANAALVDGYSVAFSYSDLFGDANINHYFGGVVFKLNDVSAIGVSVISLNSGDIVRTTEDFPEGGDPQFGDTFRFTGFSGMLSYSRLITDRLAVGGGIKFVSEGIDDAKADWLGLDVGAQFRTGLLGTTLAASIQHIGGDARYEGSAVERVVASATDAFTTKDNVPVQFDTRAITLPTAFRFSAVASVFGTPEAWIQTQGNIGHLALAVDFYDSIDTSLMPSVGLEYSFAEWVFGRVGKRWLNEEGTEVFRSFGDGFSLGAGVSIPVLERHLSIDYAWTDRGVLDNIQTFSFQFGS